MRDDIETALRTGSDQLAATLRAPAAQLVRARGEQRRRRLAAGSAALITLACAGALPVYHVLAGSPPGAAAGSGPRLSLVAPARFVQGAFNPVTFTIPAQGHRTDVTVEVDLGRSHYPVAWMPVVLRRDSTAAGGWTPVQVARPHGDWRGSYVVAVPARSLAQTLLIVPAAAGASVPVSRSGGGLRIWVFAGTRMIGEQAATASVVNYLTGSWSPRGSVAVPAGRSRKISVTLGYPAGHGYPVGIFILGHLCRSAGDCRPPRGDRIEWLDSGTWRPVRPSAGIAPMVRKSLRPGGTITLRLRLMAGLNTASASGKLSLVMIPQPKRAGFIYPALKGSRSVLRITMG